MTRLQAEKDHFSGLHMVRGLDLLPPSDPLKMCQEALDRERGSKGMLEKSLGMLKDVNNELHKKVTKYEAETPSALLLQVVQWVAFVFYY